MEEEVEVAKNDAEKGEMENVRKRRGNPREYYSIALGPLPISSSSFSYEPEEAGLMAAWKDEGRAHLFEMARKQTTYESTGERIAYSIGANFTPHIINVNTGEDVTMKILSFSQQGACAICILATTGSISNVTLRQPSSSGGTITYEGRFELLSLTGSFIPMNKYGSKSRSGGMSVSLAGPDGRVIGGGLAGMLVAASLVQVVVGSFLQGHQQEQQQKQKKQHQEQKSLLPSEMKQQQKTLQSGMKEKVVVFSNSPNPIVSGGGIEEQEMVMAQVI